MIMKVFKLNKQVWLRRLWAVIFLFFVSSGVLLQIAKSGQDRSGAAKFDFQASPFPIPNVLSQAVEYLVGKVNSSHYFDTVPDFKNQIISEAYWLLENNGYQILTEQIVMLPSEGPKGYTEKLAHEHFRSFGVITINQKHSPVQFSLKASKSTHVKLVELILHETLHHVFNELADEIANDEKYISTLTESIINSTYSNALALGITQLLVVRKDFVSGPGLARLILRSMQAKGEFLKIHKIDTNEIREVLYTNVANLDLRSFLKWMVSFVDGIDGNVASALYRRSKPYLESIVSTLDKENSFYKMGYCKIKVGWWPGARCPEDQLITLKDLFDPTKIAIQGSTVQK